MKGTAGFVETFFGTLVGQSLEAAYLNYLNDIELYSMTNRAIRNNSIYLCHLFGKVTNTSLEALVEIESKYRKPPTILPFDPETLSKPSPQGNESNELIYKYTAEDAMRDGVFVKIGEVGKKPVYFTSNLFQDLFGTLPCPEAQEMYKQQIRALINMGIGALNQHDPEDTETLKLRVVKKDKIWVTLTGEGITLMKPEYY